MALRINSHLIFLTSLWMIKYASKVRGSASGVDVNASSTCILDSPIRLTFINCSLDAPVANLETVESLALFGSKSNKSEEEFEQLAIVDKWSKMPRLSNKFQDIDVVSSGGIGKADQTQSNVILSWSSSTPLEWQFYKCMASGIDGNRKTQSVISTVKVENLSMNRSCNTTESLKPSVQSKRASDPHGVVNELTTTLRGKLKSLETKMNLLMEIVNDARWRMARMSEASDLFRDRVYVLGEHASNFSLYRANNECRKLGGYLLEIDDDEEFDFVLTFLEKLPSWSIMTGGNDVKEEGHFVYYDSGKRVPLLKFWLKGQPDNSHDEDCMEIILPLRGINDVLCGLKSRFVCEWPQTYSESD